MHCICKNCSSIFTSKLCPRFCAFYRSYTTTLCHFWTNFQHSILPGLPPSCPQLLCYPQICQVQGSVPQDKAPPPIQPQHISASAAVTGCPSPRAASPSLSTAINHTSPLTTTRLASEQKPPPATQNHFSASLSPASAPVSAFWPTSPLKRKKSQVQAAARALNTMIWRFLYYCTKSSTTA